MKNLFKKTNKPINYKLRRLLTVFFCLPNVGMIYYGLSIPLFEFFIHLNETTHAKLIEAVGKAVIGIPFMFVVGVFFLFIQLVIYAFIMEALVLVLVKNKYVVILLSAIMCTFFPLYFNGTISFRNLYDAGIDMCLAGFISGIFMGYILYCSYHKELEQKKELNKENQTIQ